MIIQASPRALVTQLFAASKSFDFQPPIAKTAKPTCSLPTTADAQNFPACAANYANRLLNCPQLPSCPQERFDIEPYSNFEFKSKCPNKTRIRPLP